MWWESISRNVFKKLWFLWCNFGCKSNQGIIFLYPNLPVNDEFPSQRPVTRSFDVWFDLHLNKRLSKQSWGWWVETPSRSLWRHCNVDPLNKPFSQKINVSCVEMRMFRVKCKWLNTIADDDSFVASPGHQHPQYCNNVIHSVYNH